MEPELSVLLILTMLKTLVQILMVFISLIFVLQSRNQRAKIHEINSQATRQAIKTNSQVQSIQGRILNSVNSAQNFHVLDENYQSQNNEEDQEIRGQYQQQDGQSNQSQEKVSIRRQNKNEKKKYQNMEASDLELIITKSWNQISISEFFRNYKRLGKSLTFYLDGAGLGVTKGDHSDKEQLRLEKNKPIYLKNHNRLYRSHQIVRFHMFCHKFRSVEMDLEIKKNEIKKYKLKILSKNTRSNKKDND